MTTLIDCNKKVVRDEVVQKITTINKYFTDTFKKNPNNNRSYTFTKAQKSIGKRGNCPRLFILGIIAKIFIQ